MIHDDTIKLLRECDAGARMGIDSIADVLDNVQKQDLRQILASCLDAHERLADEIRVQLDKYQDDGKDPSAIAKGMSWLKTNAKMMTSPTDATIADLMTDGCNMGVKSLSKYLNQYAAADEWSKDIAKKLIALESDLSEDLRDYL